MIMFVRHIFDIRTGKNSLYFVIIVHDKFAI